MYFIPQKSILSYIITSNTFFLKGNKYSYTPSYTQTSYELHVQLQNLYKVNNFKIGTRGQTLLYTKPILIRN